MQVLRDYMLYHTTRSFAIDAILHGLFLKHKNNRLFIAGCIEPDIVKLYAWYAVVKTIQEI